MRKVGGIVRIALPAMTALILAACADDDPLAAANEATGCPQVQIVGDASEVTQFQGEGRDLTDVAMRGVILGFDGGCEYDDGGVTVDLLLDIAAARGPAGTGDVARFDYFVAITDPTGDFLAKEIFTTEIALQGAAARGGVREELEQQIPLDTPAAGDEYNVLVGFQLTPDQLDYNRR